MITRGVSQAAHRVLPTGDSPHQLPREQASSQSVDIRLDTGHRVTHVIGPCLMIKQSVERHAARALEAGSLWLRTPALAPFGLHGAHGHH